MSKYTNQENIPAEQHNEWGFPSADLWVFGGFRNGHATYYPVAVWEQNEKHRLDLKKARAMRKALRREELLDSQASH